MDSWFLTHSWHFPLDISLPPFQAFFFLFKNEQHHLHNWWAERSSQSLFPPVACCVTVFILKHFMFDFFFKWCNDRMHRRVVDTIASYTSLMLLTSPYFNEVSFFLSASLWSGHVCQALVSKTEWASERASALENVSDQEPFHLHDKHFGSFQTCKSRLGWQDKKLRIQNRANLPNQITILRFLHEISGNK